MLKPSVFWVFDVSFKVSYYISRLSCKIQWM